VVFEHHPNGLGNGRVAPDRDDGSGHDLRAFTGITRVRRNLPGGDSSVNELQRSQRVPCPRAIRGLWSLKDGGARCRDSIYQRRTGPQST